MVAVLTRIGTYEPELTRFLESEWTLAPVVNEMFTENSIKIDQLRMMFSCCHPRLPEESRVMLILAIGAGMCCVEMFRMKWSLW